MMKNDWKSSQNGGQNPSKIHKKSTLKIRSKNGAEKGGQGNPTRLQPAEPNRQGGLSNWRD